MGWDFVRERAVDATLTVVTVTIIVQSSFGLRDGAPYERYYYLVLVYYSKSPGHETGTGSIPRPTSRWLHGLQEISAGMCLPLFATSSMCVTGMCKREDKRVLRLGKLHEDFYCWLVSSLGLG